MALHAGVAEAHEGDFASGEYTASMTLNRIARLLSAGHGGQILLSLTVVELLRDHLPDTICLRDLGECRLKDLNRPEHIFQVEVQDLPFDFPPLKTLEAFRHNLPVLLTNFIGREREIAEVEALFVRKGVPDMEKQGLMTRESQSHRLVALTSPGGTGKTRLALQAATELLDQFPGGVWLVELAPLTDPALVPQATLAALNIPEQGKRTILDVLIDFFREKTCLLVLDNCEHLVEACARFAESLLLRFPAKLRILASSRESLGVAGEANYRVPSLAIPDLQQMLGPESLVQYDAIRLFAERARLATPSFRLTAENAPTVAQICQRLDGIPLAIELAASRVKVLRVEQIAQRLDDRFRLLTGGSRTALPRQQTLRAAIDWSYELLTEAERILLRRLSVFAGGWTLEAAEQVCSDEDGKVPIADLLEHMSRLVNKSLVQVEESTGAEARFRLLEIIRQYAKEKLLGSGEAEAGRDRHLAFFLKFAEEAEPQVRGRDQVAWLNRVKAEHDNLRLALEWAAGGDAETHQRLACALYYFWFSFWYYQEGKATLDKALQHEGPVSPTVRAFTLVNVSFINWDVGDFQQGQQFAEQSLELYRQLGDLRGIGMALYGKAINVWFMGELERARLFMEESLACFKDAVDNWWMGRARIILGHINYWEGRFVEARRYYQESLTVCRETGDLRTIIFLVGSVGVLDQGQGKLEAAEKAYQEELTLSRQINLHLGIFAGLSHLAELALGKGELAKAESLAMEAFDRVRETGDRYNMTYVQILLGNIACHQGNTIQAKQYYEKGYRLADEIHHQIHLANAYYGLGEVATRQGQYPEARELYNQALQTCDKHRYYSAFDIYTEALATLVTLQGEAERGALLFGAVEAFRQGEGIVLSPLYKAEHDLNLTRGKEQLGEEAFAEAWERGMQMKLDEVMKLVTTLD